MINKNDKDIVDYFKKIKEILISPDSFQHKRLSTGVLQSSYYNNEKILFELIENGVKNYILYINYDIIDEIISLDLRTRTPIISLGQRERYEFNILNLFKEWVKENFNLNVTTLLGNF